MARKVKAAFSGAQGSVGTQERGVKSQRTTFLSLFLRSWRMFIDKLQRRTKSKREIFKKQISKQVIYMQKHMQNIWSPYG